MKIEKYTFGIGDRFAHQGRAQLQALFKARDLGIDVHPVWNKSNREHMIIHSKPDDVRAEADSAVAALGWKGAYHVDADHIGLKTVDGFIPGSDFFTLDVADFTGKPAADDAVALEAFYRQGVALLVEALDTTDPNQDAWTWSAHVSASACRAGCATARTAAAAPFRRSSIASCSTR